MVTMLSPVLAPPAQPPRVSLLQSVQLIQGDELGRWEAGYEFVPLGVGAGGVVAAEWCAGETARDGERPPGIVGARPYWVWEARECTSLQMRYAQAAAEARQLLQVTESYHVAREFWRGDEATAAGADWDDQPVLARPSSDTLTNGAVDFVEALACLERGLASAQRGRRGMIHATPELVTHWASKYVVYRDGNQLVTLLGTIVVTDAGYDGSGPNGEAAADNSQWAYATGMVQVRLGDTTVLPGTEAEELNRQVNTTEVYAQRLVSPSWDLTAHLAVEVAVPLCLMGPPS